MKKNSEGLKKQSCDVRRWDEVAMLGVELRMQRAGTSEGDLKMRDMALNGDVSLERQKNV